MTKPKWKVQLLGDIRTQSKDFELSVIEESNTFGQRSWGWGGPDKIILFDETGSNCIRRNEEEIAFAMSVAEKLCATLNHD